MSNCTECSNYFGCLKPDKGFTYVCEDFSTRKLSKNKEAYLDRLFAFEEAMDFTEADSKIEIPDEDDFVALIESIIGENSLVPRDINVDDRALKEYPNFFSAIKDKRGLGVLPFPRQLWIATKLFAEYCADCSKPHFFKDILNCPKKGDPTLMDDDVTFLEYGVCPKCGKTKLDLIREHKLNPYSELAVCAGQRGGKSILTSMLAAYHHHKMLKLQKPTEVYGLLSNTTLTATYVALTFKGAIDLLWTPVKDLISDSPWFIEYHKLLDHIGNKQGRELYRFSDTFLNYKHRKLLLSPSGPDKRKLRGRTGYQAGVDEIGWFHAGEGSDNKEKLSANEVYTALDRTLKTLRVATKNLWKRGFVNVPMPMGLYISSPSSAFDKIMSLIRENEDSRGTLAVHVPTWEMNPNLERSDFSKEFKNDPIKAERDYGANPPLSDSPYIEDASKVEATFNTYTNRVSYVQKEESVKDKEIKRAFIEVLSTNALSPTPPSVMAIDAGETNNSFTITIGHAIQGKGEVTESYTDAIIECMPRPGYSKVGFNKIFNNVIMELIKTFNVKVLLADRWQSSMLLDKAQEELKVTSIRYSVKKQDFDTVKSYLEGNKLHNPRLEELSSIILDPNKTNYPFIFKNKPVSHLFLQMLTVQETDKSVVKGTGMTDDIFRSYVLLHSHLLDEEFRSKYLTEEARRNTNFGIAAGGIGSVGSSRIVAGRMTATFGGNTFASNKGRA